MLRSNADTGTGKGEWLKREGDVLVTTTNYKAEDKSFWFLVTYRGERHKPENISPEELAWEKAHGWP
jgi:hypothetical protein